MSELSDSTYHSLIAGENVPGTRGLFRATDPSTGQKTGPEFSLLSKGQLEAAAMAAGEAFPAYRALTPEQRSSFLRTAAEKIETSGEQIIATAMSETGLPRPRLQGELGRTVNQLRLFAKVVLEGDHYGARIEHPLPDRKPLPRPDIRQLKLPLGPVGVFGASNFPLAFSVAGGDTASALAAGCPVVFKAHNAHPGTSQLVGKALIAAVAEHNLPSGVFSLIYGPGQDVGQALVKDPRIKAIGFTGSRSGGLAILATANARPEPIPVYAEMSSVNPVFVFDSAAKSAQELAQGFITSLNGSAGQLCTAPGLLFLAEGEVGDSFVKEVSNQLAEATGVTMLTPSICSARVDGEKKLADIPGVHPVGYGTAGSTENAPAPAVYFTDVKTFIGTPELSEEIFGAVCLIVRYQHNDQLKAAVHSLEGQLTATLHLDTEVTEDLGAAQDLLPHLEQKAGRILVNGWPTGVDVGEAIVHGGPFPATSDGRSTSVGTLAIDRFLRPVAYQNLPERLLPEALKEANPWLLARRMNGENQPAPERRGA
ncbi:aldehyde dehydrogenase (NADP(+)) [Nesterenkonia massiliensis]|uniref:aldehyde dehydrogenase (NADP(+)) n=1 Tax=Nesterenkonia massiliensis TaxID=1232429 RepID=UPI0003FE9840|nr:aldehyde dehydrogenase (NADP(+)) [Nesterenkonia massiliensis]